MPSERIDPGRSPDGWNEWSRHVLAELERLDALHTNNVNALYGRIDEYQRRHSRDLTDIKVEIAALKVKAGVWGLIGGLIPIIITLGIMFIEFGLKHRP